MNGPMKAASCVAEDCKLEVAVPVLPDRTLYMSVFLNVKMLTRQW